MTATEINELFGVTESFMLPDRLMDILFSEDLEKILDKYAYLQKDLSCDGFTDYFQEEHSSRKAMMQDFTPSKLAELVGRIAAKNTVTNCLDLCSGTGGLTIALWNIVPECKFVCEELSQRALPILIFNLAVRNISAYVSNKDILTGEVIQHYKITPGERFGKVERILEIPELRFDVCITNPPYSLKWEYDEKKTDIRFAEYGYPPKQFSDMGFIIDGLSRLKENGRVIAILPHGVLFRGNREADIRRKMIEKGNISAVIGLPDKLFLNTGIPVAVIVFGSSPDKSIMFIDASRDFHKGSRQNALRSEDIDKILSIEKNGFEIAKYSHVADIFQIVNNDYNLNISRYVDTYEPPPAVDIVAATNELLEIKRETIRLEAEIYQSILQLTARDEKTAAGLNAIKQILGKAVQLNELPKTGQIV